MSGTALLGPGLTVVLLLLAVGVYADEPAPDPSAPLRARLEQALRAQPRIHSALNWRFERPDEPPTELRAEIYREGDLAGLVLVRQEEGRETPILEGLTDGEVLVMRAADVPTQSILGANAINARLAPFIAARRRVAELWGGSVDLPAPRSVVHDLALWPEPDGYRFSFGLAVGSGVPGWLAPELWIGGAVEERPAEDRVTLRREGLELELRLTDGLPLRWSGAKPALKKRAEGWVTTPRLAVDAWKALIRRHCGPLRGLPLSVDAWGHQQPWLRGQLVQDLLAPERGLREHAERRAAGAALLAQAELATLRPAEIRDAEADGPAVLRGLLLEQTATAVAERRRWTAAQTQTLVQAVREAWALALTQARAAASPGLPQR